jgi:hypothetical protein
MLQRWRETGSQVDHTPCSRCTLATWPSNSTWYLPSGRLAGALMTEHSENTGAPCADTVFDWPGTVLRTRMSQSVSRPMPLSNACIRTMGPSGKAAQSPFRRIGSVARLEGAGEDLKTAQALRPVTCPRIQPLSVRCKTFPRSGNRAYAWLTSVMKSRRMCDISHAAEYDSVRNGA